MAKEKGKEGSGKKARVEKKTSVSSYKTGIAAEQQKMGEYSKKFGASVKSLQSDSKKFAKDLKEAGKAMIEEGIKRMEGKVSKYRSDIRAQVKENKEAGSHMASNVKLFLGEINKKKKDFQAYAKGPFADYAKAFWG